MAEIFDFYVNDNRTITFKLTEPIMLEDNGVSDWRFHIPNTVNGLDATGWAWWLVYVNAKNEKYTIPLTLEYDYDRPDAYSIATYTVDYGMSCKVGNIRFSLEAIDADTGGTILHEWHTKTYSTNVVDTLQGNQAEYAETESDIISALLIEVRNRTNQLIGGATPEPKNLIADMIDPDKVYLYVGSEPDESTGYWYYHNGTRFVPGGVYGAGVVDPVPTQGSTNAVSSGGAYTALAGKIAKPLTSPNGTNGQLLRTNGDGTTQWVDDGLPTDEQTETAVNAWLDANPEATTTVQDGSITKAKFSNGLSKNVCFKDDVYRVINIASPLRALCVALVDSNNHAILFDLSDTQNGQGVISALNGVVNIDAVCISHYHYDHIGDYETIFNAIPHDGCKFYMPEPPDADYFSSLNQTANDYISWINTQEGCEIHYPLENETVQINDVKITFNNADSSYWYNNYSPENLNYNWLSIAAYVQFGGIAMQITGDLYTESERYFFDVLKAGRQAEIYQAPHHAMSNFYASRSGLFSVNPQIVLANYGTNNEAVSSRSYTTAIADLCSLYGVPVFDTGDNGTFEITVVNGSISYDGLKPFIVEPVIKNYAFIRGLTIGGIAVEYSVDETGIKDVLKMMPNNSAITINASYGCKILRDLNIKTDAIIEIAKFVGGSTNYLWNRQDASQFIFNIDIYTKQFGQNHFNIHGIYNDANGFTVYEHSETTSDILSFYAKKNVKTDEILTLSKTGSISRGSAFSVENNAIKIKRTALCEVAITPWSATAEMDLSFASSPYYMRNGGTVIRTVNLIAGTEYQITSQTETTNALNGHVKVLAYSDNESFPEN